METLASKCDLFFAAQEKEKAVLYYTKVDCVTENCYVGLLTDGSSWLTVLLCSFNNRPTAVILIKWKTDWKGKKLADWILIDQPINQMDDCLTLYLPACLKRVGWQISLKEICYTWLTDLLRKWSEKLTVRLTFCLSVFAFVHVCLKNVIGLHSSSLDSSTEEVKDV